MPARRVATLLALSVVTLLAATPSASAAPAALPKPDHVLIVFMENKDTDEILGSKDAPYLNALAVSGASFTNAHAETHPSQPNYIAMFSGGTQGVTDDGCDHSFEAPNLGSELIAAGHTFVGYAEGLPAAGSGVCTAGRYARKHSPWVNFGTCRRPPTSPRRHCAAGISCRRSRSSRPTCATTCTTARSRRANRWAKQNLGSYTAWARTHNSLLILTFDESKPTRAATRSPRSSPDPWSFPASTRPGSTTTASCAPSRTCTGSHRSGTAREHADHGDLARRFRRRRRVRPAGRRDSCRIERSLNDLRCGPREPRRRLRDLRQDVISYIC